MYPRIDPDPGTGLHPHRWTTRTLTTRQLEEWCSNRTEADPAAYTNRVKLALVLGRTLVATRMRADNPAAVENPPDILLTNYVMLELLLTRVWDCNHLGNADKLRFVVLDELHTYRGRQGADVALLLRRVANAAGKLRGANQL